MKQKRTLFTGIAIGVLTSFLVSMMVVPGFAAGIRKTITAYVGDIDIYVDNKLKIPTDANGNRVEPMIYDGTTYLPVRAISNMLGGGKVNLIGNIIEQEFTTSSNWNLGSGLSLVMMIFIVISMAFIEKFDKNGEGSMI